jgi:hypothetical protein
MLATVQTFSFMTPGSHHDCTIKTSYNSSPHPPLHLYKKYLQISYLFSEYTWCFLLFLAIAKGSLKETSRNDFYKSLKAQSMAISRENKTGVVQRQMEPSV